MKNKSLAGAVLLGISVLAMTSCSKLPQEKIDAANLGFQEAKAAGAETYATTSFNMLQDSLRSAMENVEVQNSKIFKSFDESVTKLDGVIAYAVVVKNETVVKQESLKSEIATTISDIRKLLEENKLLITQAPKGKEGTTALIAIKGELDTIETTVTESENLLQMGDLLSSSEKAFAAREKASSINNELKEVISKYKTARK